MAEFGIVLLYEEAGNRVFWVQNYGMCSTVTQVGRLA